MSEERGKPLAPLFQEKQAKYFPGVRKSRKNRHRDNEPYGFASYKLLKGFSSGTRRTLLNPAFSQSSRTFAS